MLQVDILSAYAICGAGALAGAAMMRLADADEAHVRRAVNVCTWALVLFGMAMGSALFIDGPVAVAQQYFMSLGCLIAVLMFNGALRLLCGEKPGGALSHGMLALLVLGVGVLLPLVNVLGLALGLALALAIISTVAAWSARSFVLRPRNHPERGLGLAVLVLATSSGLRALLTLAAPGLPQTHLLQMPAQLWPAFAIFYGVLPIVVATLLLTLVNARLRHQLHLRASTDELTGVLTRRALRELAPALIQLPQYHQQGGGSLALMMMDLDHFKSINDRFGHASGDLVLKTSGALMQQQLRSGALLARYGGEEFVALVPVADMRAARAVAERMRLAVAAAPCVAADGRAIAVTLSVGVTCVGSQESLDTALQRADEALYRAKRSGRDQVQIGLEAA
jgi:diguanylate cyclase (GGDEF)-like protein